MNKYLKETYFFDYTNPEIKAFADKVVPEKNLGDVEVAVRLYYAVRDGTHYNPYIFSLVPETLTASYCLKSSQSYCIPKSGLLVALARYKGIPARLGLADVKNHISSQKLIEYLKNDIFVMHGYAELYLDGHWVKATPVFDARLCEKIEVETLEFDGRKNALFQQYNLAGKRAMEYVSDYGCFDDIPIDFISNSAKKAYPHLFHEEVLNEFHQHSLDEDLNL
ncbi:MAG: transglutaminase domain-containing protein [Gammaproteobacteria bacterium]|nr:transglutaminase domain-containing protein [Gammaproteobacteria bacterium]